LSNIIDLDVFRDMRDADLPVWRICKGACKACGKIAVSTMHEECPLDNTECSCGQWAFCVTHFEVDGEFVPRLEVVK